MILVAAEKSPASKSGFASVQAGRRAMSRLVAGDDAAAVLGDMTAEIDAGVQVGDVRLKQSWHRNANWSTEHGT